MEQYKAEFISFLLKTGSLKVGGDYSLKSKRLAPLFVNIGDFNDGESTSVLGDFYANILLNSGVDFDLVYGIPEKAISIAIAASEGLNRKGNNVHWFFTRKMPKEYGEATNLSQAEKIKALVVGRAPKNGQAIAQVDDVFTTGDTKYDARKQLQSLGEFKLPVLGIAVDRQEVGIDGKSAIEEYEKDTGTKVAYGINALELFNFLKENVPLQTPNGEITKEHVKRMATYLRVYGTYAAGKSIEQLEGKLQQKIIRKDRSVIPACDVSTLEEFEDLIKQTADVEGIGGYKIGLELGLGYGLDRVVETVRKYTDKSVIYDHQKAGTDIPDTGKNFARVCRRAGVDAVILFPQAGPETERAWIYHSLDHGLNVIVGGRMTHPAYSQSEGGFIYDEAALEMYRIAARAGISNFVVPGNKLDVIELVKQTVEDEGVIPNFYAPGFITQGGKIEDAAKVAGDYWHAIVGSAIYTKSDKRAAAIEMTSKL